MSTESTGDVRDSKGIALESFYISSGKGV